MFQADERLHIAVLGAAKSAVLAASDDRGNIRCAISVGPLAIRINKNFDQDLLSAMQLLCRRLDYPAIPDLALSCRGAAIAMSGVFQQGEEFAIQQMLRSIGFRGEFEPVICEDIWAVLAAAGTDNGCAIMASTGSNVLVRNRLGQHVTVGGWGSELADIGSGYYIGKLAIQSVLDDADGRRACSERFRSAILECLGLSSALQIVPWYHEIRRTSFWRSQISDLSIVVNKLYEEVSDSRARQILQTGSKELVVSTEAALKQAAKQGIFGSRKRCKVVIAGGLARTSAVYYENLEIGIQRLSGTNRHPASGNWPSWDLSIATKHPVIGALSFAISGSKKQCESKQYKQLKISAKTFAEQLEMERGAIHATS